MSDFFESHRRDDEGSSASGNGSGSAGLGAFSIAAKEGAGPVVTMSRSLDVDNKFVFREFDVMLVDKFGNPAWAQ